MIEGQKVNKEKAERYNAYLKEEVDYVPFEMNEANRVQSKMNDLMHEAKNAYAFGKDLKLSEVVLENYVTVFKSQLEELLQEFHAACLKDVGADKASP